MAEQLIYLAPGEGLPGFPSGHGPGLYLVDYEARTIRPVPESITTSQGPGTISVYGVLAEPQPDTTAQSDAQATEPIDNQGG